MGRKRQQENGDRGAGANKIGAPGQGCVGMSRDRRVQTGQPPLPVPPRNRFWFRLYWFPLKVLYATCHCSLRSVPDIPFYFFFNALLLLLTLMNLYWFLVSGLLAAPHPPSQPSVLPSSLPLSSGPDAGPSQARGGHVRQGEQHRQTASGRSEPPAGGQRGRGSFFSHPCLPLPQYIVAFAAKVLTGQVRELKDVREYDAAEAPSPKPSKAE